MRPVLGVLLSLVIATGCRSLSTLGLKDLRPMLLETAQTVAPAEQAPVWRTVVPWDDVDEMLLLPDDRLLIGLWNHRLMLGEGGPYVVKDATTGATIWELRRPGRATLLGLEPAMLFRINYGGFRDRQLLALDPDDGHELWKHDVPVNHSVAVAEDEGAVIVVEVKREDDVVVASVTSRALSTGDVQWSHPEDCLVADTLAPRLAILGDTLLMFGDHVAARSLQDGATLWHLPGVGPVHAESYVVFHPDGMIVPTAGGDLVAVTPSGEVAWRRKVPAPAHATTVDGDRAYVLARSPAPGTDAVLALGLADGVAQWERRIPGRVFSPILVIDDKVAFTQLGGDTTTLQIWNAATGEPVSGAVVGSGTRSAILDSVVLAVEDQNPNFARAIACEAIPGADRNRLPDRLVVYPGAVVVVQEAAIGAFAMADGARLWKHDIPGAENSYACARTNYFAAAVAGGVKAPEVSAALAALDETVQSPRMQAERAAAADFFLARARRAPASEAGAAARLDAQQLRSARMASMMNASLVRSDLVVQATDQLTTVSAKALGMTVAAIAIGQDLLRRVRWGDRTKMLRSSVDTHGATTYGHWFVRAFSRGAFGREDFREGRSGILLVDMRDGRWRELTTGPWIEAENQLQFAQQFPAVAGGDSLLIVRAAGLDSTGWYSHPRNSVGRTIGWHLPLISIMAYDLSGLRLAAPDLYGERSLQLRGRAFPLEGHADQIVEGSTTRQQLRAWFGPPVADSARSMIWESLREEAGHVTYTLLQCRLKGSGVVESCTQVNGNRRERLRRSGPT